MSDRFPAGYHYITEEEHLHHEAEAERLGLIGAICKVLVASDNNDGALFKLCDGRLAKCKISITFVEEKPMSSRNVNGTYCAECGDLRIRP